MNFRSTHYYSFHQVIYETPSLGLKLSKCTYVLDDLVRSLLGALTPNPLRHHGQTVCGVSQLPIYLVLGPFFLQVCIGCVRLVTHHLTKMRKAKYRCHSFCLRLRHRLMREEFTLCGVFRVLYRIRMISC
jgi:hypothetical protein